VPDPREAFDFGHDARVGAGIGRRHDLDGRPRARPLLRRPVDDGETPAADLLLEDERTELGRRLTRLAEALDDPALEIVDEPSVTAPVVVVREPFGRRAAEVRGNLGPHALRQPR
jgi:hypothetical protein